MDFIDTEHFGRIAQQVRARLSKLSIHTFFDVGANVGQTVGSILAHYPNAKVLAFEPAPETFQQLSATYVGAQNVVCYQQALGAEAGTMPFVNKGLSQMNRIVQAPSRWTTDVEVQTGDVVSSEIGVEHISYLKIDTEGHDLDVLRGFREMLLGQAIDLIQVEAGLNPSSSTYYASMESLKAFLEEANYRLFHITTPHFEREKRDGVKYSVPILRYCNLIFVSHAAAESNRMLLSR